ncbi:MAG: RdgB/HAM1 family non-canonical purine NTP pyrophosphatase [Planctomycetota bacterium]|nr:RdgB/HAM1 family non-canonical purine NTP pyrophosphatase [Planctomycetota bacterium]
MLTNELVLGTHNQKKLKELKQLFEPTRIQVFSLTDFPEQIEVEEDGDSFKANAEKKATQQANHLGRWVIGEDSGICVAALKGKPGIYSARFAGEDATDDDNNRKLISEMEGVSKRDANYVCHIALSNPEGEIVLNVEGKCFGKIGFQPQGEGGFGYDPYFIVPEYDITMAQLGSHVKSIISHRARAFRKFLHAFQRL